MSRSPPPSSVSRAAAPMRPPRPSSRTAGSTTATTRRSPSTTNPTTPAAEPAAGGFPARIEAPRSAQPADYYHHLPRAGPAVSSRRDYYRDPEAPRANSLVPGASALIVDERGRLLMQRRADSGN